MSVKPDEPEEPRGGEPGGWGQLISVRECKGPLVPVRRKKGRGRGCGDGGGGGGGWIGGWGRQWYGC